MRAKILFLSDLHKRDCDFSTIAGYTKAVDAVQRDILNFVAANGITHIVSLGDWYDKGYRSINRSNHDRNWDEEISASVNGNFYICLGNHFFLERDNNPEMYLIQPNEFFQPSQPIHATAPVIRVVPELRVGSVQISFFHFSKSRKEYTTERDPDVTYHIGVYHDETVVPTAFRNQAGFPGTTPTARLATLFENVDLAIVGHIHTPLGAFTAQSGNREVSMIVPGSLSITASGERNLHTMVNLPVIEISDESTVTCSLHPFDLHVNLLKFYEKKEKASREVSASCKQVPFSIPKTLALPEYLRASGHDERCVKLVDAVSESAIDIREGLILLGLIGGQKND